MSLASISQLNNLIIKNNLEILRSNGAFPGVALGEILEATVLEKLAGNKYMLAWKNQQTSATSSVPLNAGEKLLVKVDSIQPQLVLNIIGNENQKSNVQINDKLLQWRVNPESLLHVIDKFTGLTKLFQSVDLPPAISKSDIEKLIKLFDNIIFSSRTKNNPLFLKEFVSQIGLIPEKTLKQLAANTVEGRVEKPQEDNLKALLLKISSSVNEIIREGSEPDAEIMTKLVNIASFTEDALNAIEVKQAVNSVLQENDNGLMLQIPLALTGGFSLADIFISSEEKGQGEKKFSSCSVAIFLDLDFLGKIAVKANFRDGGIDCIIKCESKEVKTLVSNNLDGLRNSLSKTGYRVGYIDCVQEEGLMQKKEEFISNRSCFADHLVNFFV